MHPGDTPLRPRVPSAANWGLQNRPAVFITAELALARTGQPQS